MKKIAILIALTASVSTPTYSWSAGAATEGSCWNTKTQGFRCSDGSLAGGGSRIRVGAPSADNKSVDSDAPIPEIKLLTLSAKIPVPTCTGHVGTLSSGFKIGSGPVIMNNGNTLRCGVTSVPDTDIVTLPETADCAKIAPVLAYRKWRTYEKLKLDTTVDWKCE